MSSGCPLKLVTSNNKLKPCPNEVFKDKNICKFHWQERNGLPKNYSTGRYQ